MPSLDLQPDRFLCLIVDRILFLEDGGGRLDDTLEADRHSVGDAAVDTAVVVGHRSDLSVLHAEGIVDLRAVIGGKVKAQSKLYPFDGRYAEQQVAQYALDGIEERFADAGRESDHSGLDDAADTVAVVCGRFHHRMDASGALPRRAPGNPDR